MCSYSFNLIQIHHSTGTELTDFIKKQEIDQQIALETIHTRYSESKWIYIYTDGALMSDNNTAAAGIFSRLFSFYKSLGTNSTNFYGEIEAINLAQKQCFYHYKDFKNPVILCDSKSHIQAVCSQQPYNQACLRNPANIYKIFKKR